MEEKIQRKWETIEQEMRNWEYEELKDCTFKPWINEGILQPNNVVVVKGIGRHMEL